LKIAALSFLITLITVFRLEQVNSDRLLRLILQDLGNLDPQAVSPTVRNSILSIINRYIALHLQDFLSYLNSLRLSLADFLEAYIRSMDSLTSNTATYAWVYSVR
jgi:septum formation topological specificity factor MinE